MPGTFNMGPTASSSAIHYRTWAHHPLPTLVPGAQRPRHTTPHGASSHPTNPTEHPPPPPFSSHTPCTVRYLALMRPLAMAMTSSSTAGAGARVAGGSWVMAHPHGSPLGLGWGVGGASGVAYGEAPLVSNPRRPSIAQHRL